MGIVHKLQQFRGSLFISSLVTLTTLSFPALANTALPALASTALPALASTSARTLCFNMPVESAEATDEHEVQQRTEKWCYQREDAVSKKVFIFNADMDRARPELSLIIDENGVMTHGSLLQGKISFHKVDSNSFNPFPVPLTEPADLQAMNISILESSIDSAADVKSQLEQAKSALKTNLHPQVGTFAAAALLPWRGYWWSAKSGAMQTPMSKYDRFVAARTGTNPGAAGWERSHHGYRGVPWAGHCNGWAAASILREEPRTLKTDPRSGTIFSVSDQKGILSELDYCDSATFFGHRNRTGPQNDGDPRPDVFHKAILHYIGNLRKPLPVDHMSSPAVDNNVVSGYKMNMVSVGANRFKVDMTLTIHKYDKTLTNDVGVAPTYTKTYSYYLTTNANGDAISGSWLTGNPDFFWSPLGYTACKGHPMTEAFALQIMGL